MFIVWKEVMVWYINQEKLFNSLSFWLQCHFLPIVGHIKFTVVDPEELYQMP